MKGTTLVAILVGVGIIVIGGILIYDGKDKKDTVVDANFDDIDLESAGARIILAQMDEKEMGHA